LLDLEHDGVYGRQELRALAEEHDLCMRTVAWSLVPRADVLVLPHAYLAQDETVTDRLHQLEVALWHLSRLRPIGALQTRPVQAQDWETAWKAYYRPQQVGERIVVVPAWEAPADTPGTVAVLMDPGMAFGTGTHPTTRLCLAALERYVQPGQRILDVGTGSGILAIAAAKLGAANVLALDTDPIAVQAARENAHVNLTGAVCAALGTLDGQGGLVTEDQVPTSHEPPYDLVVANLTAAIVARLAQGLVSALRPGGWLIVSGIIDELEAKARLALDATGWDLEQRVEADGWIALIGRRT
ncbi:MAG: 50S ribosomal protein L11 methyltransferase, partial [Chloroflexi bacterium]|nr:50S ribosomal protein L11 methyltransferase [Chloroflexota bacterium]